MFFDEKQPDELGISPQAASTGAPLSFWDSYQRQYEYDKLIESQFGVEQAMIEAEQEVFTAIRQAGGTPPRSALIEQDITGVNNLARVNKLAHALRNNDRRVIDEMTGPLNQELETLRQKYPNANIQTYPQMFSSIQARAGMAQVYQQKQGSTLGALAGSFKASINPAVNPLSVLTLPVGGFGKQVLSRIAMEGVAQGGIQALEEFTGIRENKRLLGIEPTAFETAANIGGAVVLGGAFQGASEVVSFGLRKARARWFNSTPADPAPPPPAPVPLDVPKGEPVRTGMTVTRDIQRDTEVSIMRAVQDVAGTTPRSLRRGVMTDYNTVVSALDDWSGPRPWEIAPPMHTRPMTPIDGVRTPDIKPATAGATVDEIARQVDPVTMKQWDSLHAELKRAREAVSRLIGDRNVDAKNELKFFDEQIAAKEAEIARAKGKKREKLESEVNDLRDAKRQREATLLNMSPNRAEDYRREAVRIDERLRDLAPAVSRAYARAKGKWADDESLRGDIERMIRLGDDKLPEQFGPPKPDVLDKIEMQLKSQTIADAVPELTSTPVQGNEVALDAVKRHNDEFAKLEDSALDAFQAAIPKLLKAEGDDAILTFEGIGDVSLDERIVVDVDGDRTNIKEMTIRDYLAKLQEDEDELAAVMTCTVGSASKTA